MARSIVFTSNHSQAVRLPKAVAFPANLHEVEIIKIGKSRLISPVGKRWDDLFAKGPSTFVDVIGDRVQPKPEKRERRC